MKITVHSGRRTKHGLAYVASHIDRSAGIGDHVDRSRSANNIYASKRIPMADGTQKSARERGVSLSQHELDMYRIGFGSWLNAQNARYAARRQYDRIRSMEDVYRGVRTCPDETLLYVGRANDNVPQEAREGIIRAFIQWHQQTFPRAKIIAYAFHNDETTPHVHMRTVWIGHNKHGEIMPSQTAALREMEIQSPDPAKKTDRYNNPKMTYTRLCREKMIELARAAGLDIDDVPREPGKSGLEIKTYIGRELDAANAAKAAQLREYGEWDAFVEWSNDIDK